MSSLIPKIYLNIRDSCSGQWIKFSDSWRWLTSYDFQKENGKSENETKYFHEITRSNNKFTSRRLLSMFFLSAYKDRFNERWCKVHSELPMALIKVIESYRIFLKNWTNLGMSTKKVTCVHIFLIPKIYLNIRDSCSGQWIKFSDSWRWLTSYDFQKENGKSENETKYFHEITRSNNKFTSRRLLSMFFLSAYKDRFNERWCKVHSELPMALIKVIESYRIFLKNWTNLGMSTKK